MKDSMRAHAAILAAVVLIAVGIILAIAAQPAQARDVEPEWTWKVYPTDKTNVMALWGISVSELGERVAGIIAEYEAEQAALEAEQYYEYYEPAYYAPSYDASAYPTDGLTPQSGVYAYDGRVETYYSSNVLYHYRTDEWTVDDEGFYRTDEGYYVVAASDMEQGTVFEGSKGECIVLDSGCAEGVTDYYVAW